MKKLLLGVSIIILFAQCKKDHLTDTAQAAQISVPLFTETGANTFGTYVDGKPWANFGYVWIGGLYTSQPAHNVANAVTAALDIDDKGDSLYAVAAELTVTQNGTVIRNESMYIEIPQGPILKGTHQLVTTDYMFGYRLDNKQSYYSLVRSPFSVTVYQDTLIGSKHIISGKFQGTLYGYTGLGTPLSDSVKLTGGVFDAVVDN